MPDVEINLDNGKTLWSNLLQEVKEKSSKTCHLPVSLLVLGDEGSGKSSLIARLQKSDAKHGVGLEFDYIEIKDESIDENKKLNIWISSGDTYHTNLLKYALNETNFGYSCCMIVVSLSEPWNLIDSLEEWLKNLKMHIDRLKINPQNMQFFKNTLTRQFQEYSDPDLENEKQIVGKRRDTDFNYLHPSITDDPDKVLVPLEDGVFEGNLGLPLLIVIAKTDSIFTLEQNFDYNDDKFDFIQMYLRKIALKYGAALCYTSLKDDRNCDLLLNYLLHRCYGFPLMNSASVIDKDAIFIPAGWDNNKKINILSENLMDDIRKQAYSSLINKPLSLVRAHAQNRLTEPEVAEDEQVFLMKQQALIQRIKAMGSDGNIKEVSRGGSSMASSSASRGRKNVTGLTSASGNASNAGVQQANEGVLANFFSSLLNKRGVSTGSPLPNQPSGSGDLSRCDSTISELDESQKDELMSNSPSSNINNADLIQSKLKDTCEVVDPGKVTATSNINKFELTTNLVDETMEQLDTKNSEAKHLLQTSAYINCNLDEINLNKEKDIHEELKISGDTKDEEEYRLDKDFHDINRINKTIEDPIENIKNSNEFCDSENLESNATRDNITNFEESEIIFETVKHENEDPEIGHECEQECNKDDVEESEIQNENSREFNNEKLSCEFDLATTNEEQRDEISVECFEISCKEIEDFQENTETNTENDEIIAEKNEENEDNLENRENLENLELKIDVKDIQNVKLHEYIDANINHNAENFTNNCVNDKQDDDTNLNCETLTENVIDSEIVSELGKDIDNENLDDEMNNIILEEVKDEITDKKIEDIELQIDGKTENIKLQDIDEIPTQGLQNIINNDINFNIKNPIEDVIGSEIINGHSCEDNANVDGETNIIRSEDISDEIRDEKMENPESEIGVEETEIGNAENEYFQEPIEKITELSSEEPKDIIKKDEHDNREMKEASSDAPISKDTNNIEKESKDSLIENECVTGESVNVDDQPPLVTDNSKIVYEECGQLT